MHGHDGSVLENIPHSLPAFSIVQAPHPAPPPFDLLLRILSAPPSTLCNDPLQSATILLHSQPRRSSLALFWQYLSSQRAVLCGGRIATRCQLLLLPPHVQRALLSLVLTLPPSLQLQDGSVWPLLDEYSAQLLDERRRGSEPSADVRQVLLPTAECDCLLLLVRSIHARCNPSWLASLPLPPFVVPSLLALLSRHANHSTLLPHDHQPHILLQPVSLAIKASTAVAEPSAPSVTPLVSLLQSVCASSGSDWATVLKDAERGGGNEEEERWRMQWDTEPIATGDLCAFDDECFATAEQAEQTPMHDEVDDEAQQAGTEQPVAKQSDTRSIDHTFHPAAADDTASAVAAMQALLSALAGLRLHDLVGVFPTGNKAVLSDEQLRQHAALSAVIPLVDAVHGLPSSTMLERSFSRPAADSLTPASLPVELFYVFVRLLLTAAVSQQRAMVIVQQSMNHILDPAMPTYTRYTEDALVHAVTAHPHAVYHALLLPLVMPTAVSALQPQHAKLVDVCVSNNTARIDLSQQFAITLANSLQTDAAHSPATPTLSVLPSLTAIGTLVDCLQPNSNCPLSQPLIEAVVSLLCTLAASPSFASQEKQWMTRVSNLLKRLMTDGEGVVACRARKTDLLVGWGKLKALKSKYLLAAMQAEKLEKL